MTEPLEQPQVQAPTTMVKPLEQQQMMALTTNVDPLEENELESVTTLEPWEQHHAVIKMPRFAYNSISILQQSSTGFLITCTFRREKSATKEALTLLQKYITSEGVGIQGSLSKHSGANETEGSSQDTTERRAAMSNAHLAPSSDAVPATLISVDETRNSHKKVKTKTEVEIHVEETIVKETGCIVTRGKEILKFEEEGETHLDAVNVPDEGQLNGGTQNFFLVKLATMGVIYISASGKSPSSVLRIASRIVRDVQIGTQVAPQWCHRLLPVQATCSLKQEELQAVASRLVKDHLVDFVPSNEQPITYAVAFNRRGAIKRDLSSVSESTGANVFGREECIKIVTAGVEHVTTNIRVDLTNPQMVVIVELIPVAGAQSCLICAVSVLPGDLVLSKPKLNVKPLAPLNPKSKKRKHLR